MYLHGGYKTQTVIQIGNLLGALNRRQISYRALRLYFAALGAVSAREAAKRCQRRKASPSKYSLTELARLAGCPVRRVRQELRALEKAGLMCFAEPAITFNRAPLEGNDELIERLAGRRSRCRPVPLPRTVLRYLARCSRVAVAKTTMAYCVRGLSLTICGEVKGKGTVKASWIAQTCSISLRAARLSRAELIMLGFISKDTGSKQWKLNRDGAYFTINLGFGAPECRSDRPSTTLRAGRPFAAPMVKNSAPFAPPYKDMETPYGLKDQKTLCIATRAGSGLRQNSKGGRGERKSVEPQMRNIVEADLSDTRRLLRLYKQALEAQLVAAGEAGRLQFVAAAEHARRVGKSNPSGLLATILRRGLWAFITQDDEDRAAERLKLVQKRNQRPASTTGGSIATAPSSRPNRVTDILESIQALVGGQHELVGKCLRGGADSPSR